MSERRERGEESYVQEEGKKMEGWRGADSTVERKIGRSARWKNLWALRGGMINGRGERASGHVRSRLASRGVAANELTYLKPRDGHH